MKPLLQLKTSWVCQKSADFLTSFPDQYSGQFLERDYKLYRATPSSSTVFSLVYVRCCCRESWISGDWGLVKSPSPAISNFISTAFGALTLLQYDSADITAVRVSDLFWLLIEVFWDSTFARRNDCTGWESITWVLSCCAFKTHIV